MKDEEIKFLVNVLKKNSLSQIVYKNNKEKIILKQELNQTISPKQSLNLPREKPNKQKITKKVTINSPSVGTFYTAKNPKDPPLVKVGNHVSVGDTIGIVEAMKMMKEIKADKAGIVNAILVKDGQGVEFNEPLIQLK